MANGEGKILYKTHYKAGRNHDYKTYKANHPLTPKQVENLFDLGFLGVDKDFPFRTDIIFILQKKKEEKQANACRGKGVQQNTCQSKGSGNRTCDMQDKEVQDNV